MDPISIGLGAGSIISSLIGAFKGDNSKEYIDKAIQELIKVKIPDPAQQRLALERYQSAGELSPELEHAIKQDPSAFESVVKNQKLAQSQNRALTQLESLGEEGGLSLSDKADLQDQMIANSSKARADRDAVTDDMARRGQAGSGMAMQAQLAGAQASGDRDASSRLRTLADARGRALDAIQGAGDMAGKMDQADYQRQSDLAQARDSISNFNTENARGVQTRNVGVRNAAQATNLENRQNLLNSNTDLSNDEQKYNKELSQRDFENQMTLANAKAGVYQNAAANEKQSGQQSRQAMGAIGSGLGQMGATYQNQSNWDSWLENAKKKRV
jgi:hypothetical protein